MKKSLTVLQAAAIWYKYFSNNTKHMNYLKREIKRTTLKHDNGCIFAFDGENYIACDDMRKEKFIDYVIDKGMKKFVVFDNIEKMFSVHEGKYTEEYGLLQLNKTILHNYLYTSLKSKVKNEISKKAKENLIDFNKKYYKIENMNRLKILWKRAFGNISIPFNSYRYNENKEKEYFFCQWTFKDFDGTRYISSSAYKI